MAIYIFIDEEGCVGEGEENENHNQDNAGEQNEEVNEEEDDEDEEEDDDQEIYPIIEKRATVFTRWPDANKWEQVGLGNLAIHYDSDIYAERIVLKLDDSDEYASNTIISIDTVMQVIQLIHNLYKKCMYAFLLLTCISLQRWKAKNVYGVELTMPWNLL
jgi:hypothetical protein